MIRWTSSKRWYGESLLLTWKTSKGSMPEGGGRYGKKLFILLLSYSIVSFCNRLSRSLEKKVLIQDECLVGIFFKGKEEKEVLLWIDICKTLGWEARKPWYPSYAGNACHVMPEMLGKEKE
ncbi:hypothetical protein ASZ78_014655 [Callipepla squamata]|uniref:Uncharacterized protein n=1 Tax=Callipepla squamata TaxID=9009 RepID=A0A226NDR2_CALSU|nr:hypothetical protein ASZ78_014655 [Callipepla squamata]